MTANSISPTSSESDDNSSTKGNIKMFFFELHFYLKLLQMTIQKKKTTTKMKILVRQTIEQVASNLK